MYMVIYRLYLGGYSILVSFGFELLKAQCARGEDSWERINFRPADHNISIELP